MPSVDLQSVLVFKMVTGSMLLYDTKQAPDESVSLVSRSKS